MCVLKSPFSVGLSWLKSLDLHNVELLDHNLFNKFVSSRPLLEKLILKSCSFSDFKILNISSNSLKSLTPGDFGGDESGNYKVMIACPNLVSFNFLALWSPDFAFGDLGSLQNAFIFLDISDRHERDNESCHILSKILNELCGVKSLKLSTAFLRFHFLLEERVFIPNSFNYLKSLVISVSMTEWVVSSIISLLNWSPNLEALTIHFEGEECDNWKY